MQYEILLLNILKGKTDKGRQYYRLGYVFLEDFMIADGDNFIGDTEHNVYVQDDVFKYLDKGSIYKKFTLVGEMKQDYKNPLNQIFVPIKLIDKKNNYEINLSNEKPE